VTRPAAAEDRPRPALAQVSVPLSSMQMKTVTKRPSSRSLTRRLFMRVRTSADHSSISESARQRGPG